MTLKGGSSQACARCKYQRRKCTSECALAPYFPADQPKIFQNAHKLFGVSNILKIIKDLDPNQKMEAMRSIIYESNIRDKFPVHGCLGVIMQYQYQIRQVEEELHIVHAQLALYRQQEMSSTPDESSQLQLGMTPTPNALALFHQETAQHCSPVSALPISSHPSYSYSGNANNIAPAGYIDSKDDNAVNSFWIQQPCTSDNDQMPIQSQLVVSQPLTIQQGVVQDYELLDTVDDRQSYIDSKQAYESSSVSSLKDTTQSLEHVAENDLKSAMACFSLAENELKSAAACFSLTSVN